MAWFDKQGVRSEEQESQYKESLVELAVNYIDKGLIATLSVKYRLFAGLLASYLTLPFVVTPFLLIPYAYSLDLDTHSWAPNICVPL